MKLEVVIFKKLSEYDLDVCFESHEDRLGLMGPSGSGKSMVLKCIAGIMTPDAGRIVLDDEVLFDSDLKINISPQKRKIGYMSQNYALFDHMNVYQNIAAPLKAHHEDKQVIKEKVQQIMKDFQIDDLQKRYPRQLSGGQKQRVAIARALVLNPKILLCDEATSALDPQITRDILNLLLKINKEMNITIVVVTHQMEVIKQICNKVAFLKDGRVLSVGKPEELFVAPNQEIQKFVGDDVEILPQTGKNIKLFFTNNNSKSHTITQLARTLDINFDICQGKLENFRGSMMGSLIINIEEKDLQAVGNYLNQEGITWEEIV